MALARVDRLAFLEELQARVEACQEDLMTKCTWGLHPERTVSDRLEVVYECLSDANDELQESIRRLRLAELIET